MKNRISPYYLASAALLFFGLALAVSAQNIKADFSEKPLPILNLTEKDRNIHG
jgi:drug/metabolite transporter (DMT)-like permease